MVCLREISIYVGCMERLLALQFDLQCVSMKSSSLQDAFALSSTSDSPTVCLSHIAIFPGRLVRLLAIKIDLQCVSVKLPFLQDAWYVCWRLRLAYSVSQ